MKKGKRPLPPSDVPDPKQPRLPRDEGKACVCYPYSLSHLSLTKTLSSLPTLSFMLSRLEAYKTEKRKFYKVTPKPSAYRSQNVFTRTFHDGSNLAIYITNI